MWTYLIGPNENFLQSQSIQNGIPSLLEWFYKSEKKISKKSSLFCELKRKDFFTEEFVTVEIVFDALWYATELWFTIKKTHNNQA